MVNLIYEIKGNIRNLKSILNSKDGCTESLGKSGHLLNGSDTCIKIGKNKGEDIANVIGGIKLVGPAMTDLGESAGVKFTLRGGKNYWTYLKYLEENKK
ncbi:MAG TPA: hypothetical protein ENG87_04815 [Candidatus Pacearchaeota archaeon]|nr:hypothetical protein BMS3Abin17_00864 [archaeon BMS3Abin17]HDK42679.1 hypothetical protein [Candidatus Pacearchaeota archaeon]HDZ61347.1 hypothetical protein [Candidatus Pacearchaeota archaeon]